MIQSGVDLAVGGVDRVRAPRNRVGVRLTDQRDQRTEETHAQFDEEHAEFETERSQTIASAPPDTFDQAFRTQLAEVVSKLAEVLVVAEVMASDDACVQFAGGPVANEATRMQQRCARNSSEVGCRAPAPISLSP